MTASLPLWPFALLAGLLLLGLRQSVDRVVEPGALVRVAVAMAAFSLYGVTTAFGAAPLPVLAWAVGLVAALVLGASRLAPRGLASVGDAVRLPGSWLPLALMLGIFGAKFALGVATGLHTPVVQAAWFAALASTVFGLFSGAFAVRALAVYRFMQARRAAA